MGATLVLVCGLAACSGTEAPQASRPETAAARADTAGAMVASAAAAPWASQVRRAGASTSVFLPSVALAVTTPVAPAESMHAHHGAVHEHHGSALCAADECDSCHEHRRRRCRRCCVRSTCDMVPHLWSYPESHGYYYFRPYHYTHVDIQRDFIKSIDGDPRNPYADGLFERLYEEMAGAAVEPYAPETE